jgi:coenzyme F420 hydrogenase subunit beta
LRRISDLDTVVRYGLCSGCGLCEGIAGRDRIRMEMSPQGFLRPVVRQNPDPETMRHILASCPGVRVDGRVGPPQGTMRDTVWGRYARLAKGQAADPEIRFKASSGGVSTQLCAFLLDTGRVDFVLHVAASRSAPMRSEARLSFDRAQLLEGAGARYGPAAPLLNLGALLERKQRFAVVGKPCDIAAIRNYARLDERVDAYIPYTLSFFCGGVPSLAISQRMIAKYGLTERNVRLLRYRGHGCPGMTRIESHDGRAFEQTYDETWGDELNQDIQFRCKICADATGEQADIVLGDAWATENGYPGYAEQEGWNAIIARTSRGHALLTEAAAAGVLCLEPLTAKELGQMQPHHVERKKAILARLSALAVSGQPSPRYRRLRLWRSALLAGARNWRNFRGTLRRVRRGSNREP